MEPTGGGACLALSDPFPQTFADELDKLWTVDSSVERLVGKNAILLCPEVAFDQRSGNPGNLGNADGFKALLQEVLSDLGPRLGGRAITLPDVGQVIVASHSGGYQAAAGIAARGGVAVDEVWLFDSLYGGTMDFDHWVRMDLPGFQGAQPPRRFADFYTQNGGTLANSQAMAARAASWLGDAGLGGDGGVLVDDRTNNPWPLSAFGRGLLFKYSALPHDGVPAFYFSRLLESSRLPDKR